jgi:hypothetical protein
MTTGGNKVCNMAISLPGAAFCRFGVEDGEELPLVLTGLFVPEAVGLPVVDALPKGTVR